MVVNTGKKGKGDNMESASVMALKVFVDAIITTTKPADWKIKDDSKPITIEAFIPEKCQAIFKMERLPDIVKPMHRTVITMIIMAGIEKVMEDLEIDNFDELHEKVKQDLEQMK
jgi:hypothetical protein